MSRIIINADDFGKSPSRNRAINDAFEMGLISSAGLIVTGKYLQDAIRYVDAGDYFEKVHLHFNLSANLLHEGSDDAPISETMKKDSFFCKDDKFIMYNGLPHQLSDILKWKVVYEELEAQYKRFIDVTKGKGDLRHVDFHMWYNLTWPVSLALNLFTRKYHVKSVRYMGKHQEKSLRYKVYRLVSWNPCVKYIPATNIDYYLSNEHIFEKYPLVELYCHPNYKENVFLDDSPSYLKHDRQPMQKQIQMLKEKRSIDLVSWDEIY